MRHNGRKELLASRMKPTNLAFLPGQPMIMVCPECQTWRRVQRHMIVAHRMEDLGHGRRNRRCIGSGQRIQVDIDLAAWTADWNRKHEEASTDAAGSRPTQPTPKPHAAAQPPAVMHMDTASRSARSRLAIHQDQCPDCRSHRWCETVINLRKQIKRSREIAATMPATAPSVTVIPVPRAAFEATVQGPHGRVTSPLARIMDGTTVTVSARIVSTRQIGRTTWLALVADNGTQAVAALDATAAEHQNIPAAAYAAGQRVEVCGVARTRANLPEPHIAVRTLISAA